MADEERAFGKGRPRSVWLCYTLTYDRGEPIKRLLSRSDWPPELRLLAPTSGRIQYLETTARLCDLALDGLSADEQMMKIIAADHARDLPGVKVRKGEFPLEEWRAVALEHLGKLKAEDEEKRREAAQWLSSRLGERQMLYGAPEVIEGDGGRARFRGGDE